jgi:hypothetical protein
MTASGLLFDSAAYDSVAGIERYLANGLAGLNRLMSDRSAAGYERHEHLRCFVILGRWSTDGCGNFGRCTLSLYGEPLKAELPQVTTWENLRVFKNLRMESAMDAGVPPTHVRCPECAKGWVLETAHDTFVSREDRVVSLTAGATIKTEEFGFANNSEGVFRFGPEPGVRNAKWIDTAVVDGRIVNEKGWRHHHPPFKGERLTRDYVAEEGDSCSITVWLFHHRRCWEIKKVRQEYVYFREVFEKAGATGALLKEIPNSYCPCETCGPWFVARLPYGDITIGWRKRVINIDWSSTKVDLSGLFLEEDTTKGAHMIHAWGKDKAIDYVGRIHAALK